MCVCTCRCVQYQDESPPRVTSAVYLASFGRLVCGHSDGSIAVLSALQAATVLMLEPRRFSRGKSHQFSQFYWHSWFCVEIKVRCVCVCVCVCLCVCVQVGHSTASCVGIRVLCHVCSIPVVTVKRMTKTFCCLEGRTSL